MPFVKQKKVIIAFFLKITTLCNKVAVPLLHKDGRVYC